MVNLFSSVALAELKSAMSLSEADMADYRVQRTGEDGLNGKESNSNNNYKQITKSHMHCSSSSSILSYILLELSSICQGI